MPLVPTDLLDPPEHPLHPLGQLTAESDLVVSIRAMGMLEPILVRSEGNRFRIVHGQRRHEAAQLIHSTDAEAMERVERDAVQAILAGIISPDTDFLSAWVERFGGSMVRGFGHV